MEPVPAFLETGLYYNIVVENQIGFYERKFVLFLLCRLDRLMSGSLVVLLARLTLSHHNSNTLLVSDLTIDCRKQLTSINIDDTTSSVGTK